ncbi:gamma-type small acid-soluble spore protein [Sporosarcina sp. Marseille-Q4063]|uniref:gamma-type small acid-soluble spore protein n=1 Tax=Sporosarcina sp. Marseille-Q4063 TaxID=2810514 RepID=UPI001BB02077|nr:gamma-type small acid-soluble spore protein [Sporosarcina sp. Marseille-Q4063]QUW23488.1 gamma-type small acid-soluble spore protein [Sporosarcina sp. Marseille-Q4063]
MTKNQNPNQTNANQVRQQNQQSLQGQSQNPMGEEFGSETDLNQVRKQNQQSEAKKQQQSSGMRANRFENGSK